MNRSVEETATDPRDSLSRYLAALTNLRFEPLSQKYRAKTIILYRIKITELVAIVTIGKFCKTTFVN
jgi:hypothetical protein